jgi:hypothetical protein
MHNMIRPPDKLCGLPHDDHAAPPHRSIESCEQKRAYGREHDPARRRRARAAHGDAIRALDRERRR